jgi:Domain of unknown function (DUF4331)
MIARMNLNRLFTMLGVVGFALGALTFAPKTHIQKVYGSDHREAPTVDGLQEGDLTDVYVFVDPNDSTHVDFIMNVNPFANAAESLGYSFSPSFLYQFKIDNTGDAVEDQVIQVMFNTNGQGQVASVYGPAAPTTTGARNTLLTSKPTATGTFNTTFGTSSGVQAFAGMRDDPFVFDFAQFTRILNNEQDLFRGVGTFRGRPVRADGTSGVDIFAGFNLSSIVVSVPISMIKGSGPTINVWATVSQQIPTRHGGNTYQQFERQGQQAFATIFIPSGAARDAQNFEIPQDDVANYSSLIPDALTVTDNDGSGNTIAGRASLLTALGLTALPNGAPLLLPSTFANSDKNLLREALLPDVLRLNVTQPYGTLGIGAGGLQNGRIIDYDDIDVALELLRQLADVQFPSGIPGGGTLGSRVALNCVAYPACADRRVLVVVQGTQFIKADNTITTWNYEGNDLPFPTTFPYLAPPHPLPGDAGTVNYPVQQ